MAIMDEVASARPKVGLRVRVETVATRLLTPAGLAYLQGPIGRAWLPIILIVVNILQFALGLTSYPFALVVLILSGLAAIALVLRARRWLVYLLLFAAIAIQVYSFVHLVANGPQDLSGSRDTAVEAAAYSLLHGQNAWNAEIGANLTTGPTSILLALPFVALFGEINWLSFVFWIALIGSLVYIDVQYRNSTWPCLATLFLLGWAGIQYTMFWALEELYFPVLYLLLAYALVRQRQWLLVGALFAASILTRPNYIFLIIGYCFWIHSTFPVSRRDTIKLAAGFMAASLAIVLPFVLVGGKDFWIANPWLNSTVFLNARLPETSPIFSVINNIGDHMKLRAVIASRIELATLFFLSVTWLLRGAKHPFWHLASAALISYAIFFLTALVTNDYTLTIVLPVMLALSMIQPMNKIVMKEKLSANRWLSSRLVVAMMLVVGLIGSFYYVLDNTRRAQMAVYLVSSYTNITGREVDCPSIVIEDIYDLPETEQRAICGLYGLGLTRGVVNKDGVTNFDPNRTLLESELFTFLSRWIAVVVRS